MDAREFVEQTFPDGVWVGTGDEYLTQCPYCGSGHRHLYINVTKRLFNCYRCGEKGPLRRLVKEFGDGAWIESQTESSGLQQALIREKIDLDDTIKFPRIWDGSGRQRDAALEYLLSRGMTLDEIKAYDTRTSACYRKIDDRTVPVLYGRAIFPIRQDGQIVSFSARSVSKVSSVCKYMTPSKGETLLTTAECFFGWDRVDLFECTEPHAVVLVEGVMDVVGAQRVLGSEYWVIGALGKLLTDVKRERLVRLANHLDCQMVIMFDADAYSYSVRAAAQLFDCGVEAYYALLERGDPGSCDKEEITRTIADSHKYVRGDEVRVKLDAEFAHRV